MKKENGITLISLAVMITLLTILSSVTLKIGTDAYISMKQKSFISRLKVIQSKVDVLSEDSNLDTSSFTSLSSLGAGNSDYQLFTDIIQNPEDYNINTNVSWNSTLDSDVNNYYYFTPETLKSKLGLNDQSYTVIINFKTRNIITNTIISKDGEDYYRQYDLDGGDTLTNNYTLFEQITSANYGDYIELGTDFIDKVNIQLEGNETIKSDWRIFYKDDKGVWVILADYLPINESNMNAFIRGTESNQLDLDTYTGNSLTSYPYCVFPKTRNRNSAITGLNKKEAWKNILPDNLKSNSNIEVVGAIDVETWLKSWNSNTGYTHLATSLSTEMTDGYKGYYIGEGNDGDSISTTGVTIEGNGYSDTLYLTHKGFINNCYGYWLASPAASSITDILFVGENNPNNVVENVYGIYIGRGDCWHGKRGVRPAVYLPSNILAEQDTNDIWQIKY